MTTMMYEFKVAEGAVLDAAKELVRQWREDDTLDQRLVTEAADLLIAAVDKLNELED